MYETLCTHRNPIQCIADHCKIFATSLGHHQSLALALEKLDAERSFQRLELLAHRSLRDAQLFSCSRDALASRRSVEGLEGIQRRQTTEHRAAFMRKTKAG